jgi:hypothetical protein
MAAGPIGYENLGVTVITTMGRDVTMVAEMLAETSDTNSGSARPMARQDTTVTVYCMAVANYEKQGPHFICQLSLVTWQQYSVWRVSGPLSGLR